MHAHEVLHVVSSVCIIATRSTPGFLVLRRENGGDAGEQIRLTVKTLIILLLFYANEDFGVSRRNTMKRFFIYIIFTAPFINHRAGDNEYREKD
jgi:hypothetical protein